MKLWPAPPDLRRVPVPLTVSVVTAPATWNRSSSFATFCRFLTLSRAPLRPRRLLLAAPPRVAPPLTLRARVSSSWKLAVIARGPPVVVWPLPVMFPPVHLEVPGPATDRRPLAVGEPALRASV